MATSKRVVRLTARTPAAEVIEAVREELALGDGLDEARVAQYLGHLEEHAAPEHASALLSLLSEGADGQTLLDVLVLAENLGDDAYLPALAQSWAALELRAPTWLDLAAVRILNTAGEEDDCVDPLAAALCALSPDQRTAAAVSLTRLLDDPELTVEQRGAAANLRDRVSPSTAS